MDRADGSPPSISPLIFLLSFAIITPYVIQQQESFIIETTKIRESGDTWNQTRLKKYSLAMSWQQPN